MIWVFRTLLHDLAIQYQSYFRISALELAESLCDVVEEELKEKLAKSPVVSALTDEVLGEHKKSQEACVVHPDN